MILSYYKLLNYLFGWDYILWSNIMYKGISRIRKLPNGDVYFLAYGSFDGFNNVTTGTGNGEKIVAWLTCDESKYLNP